MSKIPYKIYLSEDEMPTQWYNVRADMKNKPAPLLNPATLQPLKKEELEPIFCSDLCDQELDNDTKWFDIPVEIQDFYKMCRPSPLIRAYYLEKALGTPAKIYYKFEGNNTSRRHTTQRNKDSRVSPQRQEQDNGALRSAWRAHTSTSTARYIW